MALINRKTSPQRLIEIPEHHLVTKFSKIEIAQRGGQNMKFTVSFWLELRGVLSNFVQLCDCAIFGHLTMTLSEKSVLARTRVIVQLCDYSKNTRERFVHTRD